MKIKVAYGVDMRLWKYQLGNEESGDPQYDDLVVYVCKSFGFEDAKEFVVRFEDENGSDSTVSTQQDLVDAFAMAQKGNKKSLKLKVNSVAQEGLITVDAVQGPTESNPISSTVGTENGSYSDGFGDFVHHPPPPHAHGFPPHPHGPPMHGHFDHPRPHGPPGHGYYDHHAPPHGHPHGPPPPHHQFGGGWNHHFEGMNVRMEEKQEVEAVTGKPDEVVNGCRGRGRRGRGRGGCRGRGFGRGRGGGRGHHHRGKGHHRGRGHHRGHHGPPRGFHGPFRGHHGRGPHGFHHGPPPPAPEDVVAFLSDDESVGVLSELLVVTFEAVQESNFEIGIPETLQAMVLSDDRFKAVTENAVWPFFVNELVPRAAPKIMFFAQMMRMNGQNIDGDAVKQWIPAMLNVMKENAKNGHCGPRRGRGCGRGRGRGRGGRGHHGPFWGHRGRGHFHHPRGGRRGRGRGGFHRGPWEQPQDGDAVTMQAPFEGSAPDRQLAPSAPVNESNDMEEVVSFEYTDELVAIMNMGFSDMGEIKRLLNEHNGNKQNVVQELVAVQ